MTFCFFQFQYSPYLESLIQVIILLNKEKNKGFYLCLEFIRFRLFENFHQSISDFASVPTFMFQFLCNVIVLNRNNQQIVWQQLFPREFMLVCVAIVEIYFHFQFTIFRLCLKSTPTVGGINALWTILLYCIQPIENDFVGIRINHYYYYFV